MWQNEHSFFVFLYISLSLTLSVSLMHNSISMRNFVLNFYGRFYFSLSHLFLTIVLSFQDFTKYFTGVVSLKPQKNKTCENIRF